ncbi:MAG: glycogen synthase GlgA [Campylobacterales bacterium]
MRPLKILFAASECAPFAKTGGLGDVVGVLPKYLAKLGHDVRVVMPRYYKIDRATLTKLPAPLGVPMGIIGEQWCAVYEGRLPGSDVPIYFLDHEGYYGRAELYNDEHGHGFLDNDNRFVFLSRGAMQLCKYLHWIPNILHAHDWHTAAVPLFLNTLYRLDPHFSQSASVLTIHNMQYQGNFYPGLMDVLGVGAHHFHAWDLEHNGQVNLLKGGILHADKLTTVSPTYAREIATPAFGWGLELNIQSRERDLTGILNGVDYNEWNPAHDRYLPATYSDDDLSGKAICKEALQRRFNLPVRPEVPLFGMVARLVDQKGIDLLADILPHLLNQMDIQVVLLGTGEPWAHHYFSQMADQRPDKFGCFIGYSEQLAHLIEAGSDFYLMPSRFEPCGLNQMYSLAYGTPPIVHATGGLEDTIENFDEAIGSGTGFKFYDATPQAFYNTIGWAVYVWYNQRDSYQKMQQRGMRLRFSWEEASRRYEEVYRSALEARGITI